MEDISFLTLLLNNVKQISTFVARVNTLPVPDPGFTRLFSPKTAWKIGRGARIPYAP